MIEVRIPNTPLIYLKDKSIVIKLLDKKKIKSLQIIDLFN